MKLFGYEIGINLTKSADPEILDLRKEIDTLKERQYLRPSLDDVKTAGSDGVREKIDLFPVQTYYDTALFSDTLRTIIMALRGEILRKGITIEPKFAKKCKACQAEYAQSVEICECGSADLVKPDKTHQERLKRFVKKANDNRQSMRKLLEQVEDDINIADDYYLVAMKRYSRKANGEINAEQTTTIEFIRAFPGKMKIIADKSARLGHNDKGEKVLTCVFHRTELYTNRSTCPKCGTAMLPAHYESIRTDDSKFYYVEGEVMHGSRYAPSLTYGFSPVASIWQKVTIMINQDSWLREYYGRMRPPKGLLLFNSAQQSSVQKAFEWALDYSKRNPHSLAPLAIPSNNGKQIAQVVDFMRGLSDMQFTEAREEFRRTIGALYGVMPLFGGDTSKAGGLNNEGLQITVTNRAVERAQEMYNAEVFPFIEESLHVTDYCLVLELPEMRDELNEETIRAKRIENAEKLLSMGISVKLLESGEFEYGSGDLTKPITNPLFGGPPTPPSLAPDFLSSQPSDKPDIVKASDIAKAYALEDGFSKDIAKAIDDAAEPVLRDALFGKAFEGMTLSDTNKVRNVLLDAMLSRDRPPSHALTSLPDIVKKIMSAVGTDEVQAERIARTEFQSMSNTLREYNFKKYDPEGKSIFKWIGPNDHRTTQICEAIKQRSQSGVPIEKLREIVKEESIRGGFDGSREWTPHINCRHTFVRVL